MAYVLRIGLGASTTGDKSCVDDCARSEVRDCSTDMMRSNNVESAPP